MFELDTILLNMKHMLNFVALFMWATMMVAYVLKFYSLKTLDRWILNIGANRILALMAWIFSETLGWYSLFGFLLIYLPIGLIHRRVSEAGLKRAALEQRIQSGTTTAADRYEALTEDALAAMGFTPDEIRVARSNLKAEMVQSAKGEGSHA